MFATFRHYEGIDRARIEELTRKVNETLIPRLSELPGFGGYFLLEGDSGAVKSISLFDTTEHAADSTRVAAEWMEEQKLESLAPNAPKVTVRAVLAHATRAAVPV